MAKWDSPSIDTNDGGSSAPHFSIAVYSPVILHTAKSKSTNNVGSMAPLAPPVPTPLYCKIDTSTQLLPWNKKPSLKIFSSTRSPAPFAWRVICVTGSSHTHCYNSSDYGMTNVPVEQ